MVETIYEQFREAAQDMPSSAFLCYPSSHTRGYYPDGIEFTYAQALATVNELAERYAKAGYVEGQRVALMAGNRPEHFWHLFALNSLGISIVTLNPEYLPHELDFGIQFPDCALVLSAPPYIESVRKVSQAFAKPVSVVDVSIRSGDIPPPSRPAVMKPSPPAEREALVIYTSGTTGRPKGCMISNKSCLAAAESYTTAGGLLSFVTGKERLYIPLPAFHMNVSVYTLNSITRLRSCLIMQDRFSASTWWSDLVETRATCFHYLGIIPPLLLKMPPSDDESRHCAKFGYGAGVDPAVREAFEKRFGPLLIEAWGMTETSRTITNSTLPRCLSPRAFGRPRKPLQVRIVNDKDLPVPEGQPGELLVRVEGPDPRSGFFSGYLNQPEETEDAWRGGWFHTGDIVKQNADGILCFVDRKKNGSSSISL